MTIGTTRLGRLGMPVLRSHTIYTLSADIVDEVFMPFQRTDSHSTNHILTDKIDPHIALTDDLTYPVLGLTTR